MSKNLIFCFDGTCNDPEDATQEETFTGGAKDNSITNVLKLHLLLGGDFKKVVIPPDDTQKSLYYSGVGTYGSKFKRAFNAALAPENLDVRDIINDGLDDFNAFYEDNDRIFIFGFSRGAAIARRFASILELDHGNPPVRFLGVFDTVASIGIPNLSKKDRPASDVVFERGHTIAGNITEALHLVSLDEKRKAFQPTLMNYEDRVTEIWFPGAHADVGGGYHRDGLSDVTLRLMLDELDRRSLGLRIIPPSKVDYAKLLPDNAGYSIDFSDVIIEPDIFSKNHQQRRPPMTAWLTLDDRELRVNENDLKSERKPVVHHSVTERIYGDREYRPKSLQGVQHKILSPDGSRKEYMGLQHHQETGMRPLSALQSGESKDVIIYAHQKYNRTGLMLQKGVKYTFEVKGDQTWKDGGVTCGPEGWDRSDVTLGLKEIAIAGMEPFRRCPDANWFALIGCIGDNDENSFLIGDEKTLHTPLRSAEFSAFANDLSRSYGNNQGRIRLTVTRLD